MEILKNIPLHDKNWFQTGGPAKFFCEPQNENDFSKAVKFAAENNLKIFVLGEGANILISDNGFDGLVIHPKLSNICSLHFFVKKSNPRDEIARAKISFYLEG